MFKKDTKILIVTILGIFLTINLAISSRIVSNMKNTQSHASRNPYKTSYKLAKPHPTPTAPTQFKKIYRTKIQYQLLQKHKQMLQNQYQRENKFKILQILRKLEIMEQLRGLIQQLCQLLHLRQFQYQGHIQDKLKDQRKPFPTPTQIPTITPIPYKFKRLYKL